MTTRISRLEVTAHPLLRLGAFVARFATPLGQQRSPAWLRERLSLEFAAPLPPPDDAIRRSVRALLRHGGFKPSGRSKPASEFLLRAATRGELGSINPAVDLCNVASLHSGLPISVVDVERVTAPLRVAVAAPGSSYVFNASGQVMKLDGLLCLHDRDGPCANPVKDSQRSKTGPDTRTCLCLVWGADGLRGRTDETLAWYQRLHAQLSAETEAVALE